MTAEELAVLVDAYYESREERLAAQRKVDEMDAQEKYLKAQLIEAFRNGKITAAGGKAAIIRHTVVFEPSIEEIDKLYAHIRTTGEFDLLYRRINAKAVKERKDVGVDVPGITWFPVDKLSISKQTL
jgi:hypothetical protein